MFVYKSDYYYVGCYGFVCEKEREAISLHIRKSLNFFNIYLFLSFYFRAAPTAYGYSQPSLGVESEL